MNIKNILEIIEQIAPSAGQAHWDRSGMQVAREGGDINALAVFLDPTPENINRAISAGAEFLLSHHPLSLKPDLPWRRNSYYYCLRALFLANACLYAAHTSLDARLSGPAGWLGRSLGLENIEALEQTDENPKTGYGGIGNLPMPMPCATVIEEILKLSHCQDAALCGPPPKDLVSRIAWCPGSGSSFIFNAAARGADLYITGDIKHHAALDAPIPVLDVGHHSLEEEMMRRFAQLLTGNLPDLHVHFFPSVSPFKRACQ